jgi:hypothetical protein
MIDDETCRADQNNVIVMLGMISFRAINKTFFDSSLLLTKGPRI